KETTDSTKPMNYNQGHRHPPGIHRTDESWTIIGVEKRPLPPNSKRPDSYSTSNPRTRASRQSAAINKCDEWVKNREQDLGGPYASEGFRVTPRSNSAPTIGTQPLWQSQVDSKKGFSKDKSALQAHLGAPKVDYSCYTEMFKNVLEYYGTKKLRPKSKLTPENVRLLSIKT
ncbi:hypothetical protein QZH41_016742, partial [Actinostola sp. cb2023]